MTRPQKRISGIVVQQLKAKVVHQFRRHVAVRRNREILGCRRNDDPDRPALFMKQVGFGDAEHSRVQHAVRIIRLVVPSLVRLDSAHDGCSHGQVRTRLLVGCLEEPTGHLPLVPPRLGYPSDLPRLPLSEREIT
ncbi:hypothetical protein AB0M44_10175 [Streptosporangium subroseum]|uniref:hypothetical protein n=1 Tax=Streptosporangium subroseum TaxID=106412 RepID=UPI00341CAC62